METSNSFMYIWGLTRSKAMLIRFHTVTCCSLLFLDSLADIPECTELLPDGLPMHTCDAALHNYCVEQEGGFSCACMDGFTMEEGNCHGQSSYKLFQHSSSRTEIFAYYHQLTDKLIR